MCFRQPIDNLTPEERDARTVFCMQLAARIRPRDLEEFFSAVGKVSPSRSLTPLLEFIFILESSADSRIRHCFYGRYSFWNCLPVYLKHELLMSTETAANDEP